MRESVVCVLKFEDNIFSIQRRMELKAFGGYWSFPGGKIDPEDKGENIFSQYPETHINALNREMDEELEISLFEKSLVESIEYLGYAMTPSFHKHRFNSHFYLVNLKLIPKLKLCRGEILQGKWATAKEFVDIYNQGKLLIVPPMRKILFSLAENFPLEQNLNKEILDPTSLPAFEVLKDIIQIPILSNTLPPADATNAYILGQGSERSLIDPSPRGKKELNLLVSLCKKEKISRVFITHHHSDHHEYLPELIDKIGCVVLMNLETKSNIDRVFSKNYLENIKVEYLKDGDYFCKWLGKDVFVKSVPGHDNGQLALTVKSMEWFLVGDLIQGKGSVVIGEPEGDMKTYMETLEEVISMNPQVLFPSHGAAMGGVEILREVYNHRCSREKFIRDHYHLGWNEEKILRTLYKDIDQKLHPYALKNIRAHLKKIKSEN